MTSERPLLSVEFRDRNGKTDDNPACFCPACFIDHYALSGLHDALRREIEELLAGGRDTVIIAGSLRTSIEASVYHGNACECESCLSKPSVDPIHKCNGDRR
jgi:hypothetical protein